MLNIREFDAPLSAIITETPETKTFRFALPEQLSFAPGQWVMLTKEINGEKVSRPFSIATPPSVTDYIDITIKLMDKGKFSTYACTKAKEGELFRVKGPYGVFTFDDAMRDIMLIGAGSGVVPLMCMLRHIHGRKLATRTTLLYSSKSRDYIIYRDELDFFANNGFRIVHTLTREANSGYSRRIDKEMIGEVAGNMDKYFFICGPPAMVDSCAEALRELGASQERIKTERYD